MLLFLVICHPKDDIKDIQKSPSTPTISAIFERCHLTIETNPAELIARWKIRLRINYIRWHKFRGYFPFLFHLNSSAFRENFQIVVNFLISSSGDDEFILNNSHSFRYINYFGRKDDKPMVVTNVRLAKKSASWQINIDDFIQQTIISTNYIFITEWERNFQVLLVHCFIYAAYCTNFSLGGPIEVHRIADKSDALNFLRKKPLPKWVMNTIKYFTNLRIFSWCEIKKCESECNELVDHVNG